MRKLAMFVAAIAILSVGALVPCVYRKPHPY